MALTEKTRRSDVVLFEHDNGAFAACRTVGTMVSGTAASKVGQVLGKITIGGATAGNNGAGAAGANTGNGTFALDGTTPILANAQVGVYTVMCTVAGTNSATFRVTDPKGNVLGDTALSGAGATASFADQIKFVITDGTTDFVVGDGFKVTIAAGSGKYTQVAPAALDGSSVAAAVLLQDTDASGADATGLMLTSGPSIVKQDALLWTAGMTSPQKTTALAQLVAAGIQARTALGV